MKPIRILIDWIGRRRASMIHGEVALAAVLLVAWPRPTDLGGYVIVDEADHWRWATEPHHPQPPPWAISGKAG